MIRNIEIRAVLGGFIVQVGCQTVVFRGRQEMLAHLDAYLQNPEVVEKDFLANAENARFFPTAIPMPTQMAGQGAEVGHSANETQPRDYYDIRNVNAASRLNR